MTRNNVIIRNIYVSAYICFSTLLLFSALIVVGEGGGGGIKFQGIVKITFFFHESWCSLEDISFMLN